MQNDGYEPGKNTEMKDNTLEHFFDFAPHYEIFKLTENKFLTKKRYKIMMN
jgi:hypothetical protein